MNAQDLWLRLRAFFLRGRVEQELDEELQFHIDMQTRKNRSAGMTERDATLAARREFGIASVIQEECRDARGLNVIDSMWRDVKYALRGFGHSPGFPLTVIFTIAAGLGLNAAMFTLFNAYVLRPIAARDPYSLYEFTWRNKQGLGHWFRWAEYQEVRKQTRYFSETIAWRPTLTRVDGRPVFVEMVTNNYFQMLGIGPELGRIFVGDLNARPGTEPVAVISYAAWVKNFGRDANIVGKKVLVRGHAFEIIGVARDGFTGLSGVTADIWVPLSMIGELESGPDFFGPEAPPRVRVSGRLQPHMTVSRAKADLTDWTKRATAESPESEKAVGAELRSQATVIPITPQAALAIAPILVAFGLVLVLACANVANMLLARAMARQREIGIRLSLGAARGRLIRQLLTESVLLAIPSAVAGFVLSQFAVDAGQRVIMTTVPSEFSEYIRILPLNADGRVFLFMVFAAIASALMFGLAPALQATRMDLVQAARGDFGATYRTARLRSWLVTLQVSVAAMLLITAGVFLRSVNRIDTVDSKLRTRDVIEIETGKDSRRKVLEYLRGDPAIQLVGSAEFIPMDGAFDTVPIAPAGQTHAIRAAFDLTSPEFFDIFGIPILRGRNFTGEESRTKAPVVIITQATAQVLWPNSDALGQLVQVRADGAQWVQSKLRAFQTARVIGIARNAATGSIADTETKPCAYFPANTDESGAVVVRVSGDPERARQRIDTEMTGIAPGSIEQIHKMQELAAGRLYPFRVAYWVSMGVGALALVLTLSGIYGVLAYVVTRRTKEIGIRVALGASTRSVTSLVFRECARMAVAGVAIGAVLAYAWTRTFAMFVVISNVFDAMTYLLSIAVVLVACSIAAVVPVRRAARVDPVTALRWE